MRKYRNRSLLGKILGVYSVKLAGVDAVHILMMENTLHWINKQVDLSVDPEYRICV